VAVFPCHDTQKMAAEPTSTAKVTPSNNACSFGVNRRFGENITRCPPVV